MVVGAADDSGAVDVSPTKEGPLVSEALRKVSIKRVVGPTPNGAAVFLGNDEKTFVIFIGYYEAMALLRELKNEDTPRPLTHDLLQSVFLGFDVVIKQIIVSDIIDDAFCATLILEQKVSETNGQWAGRRNEVRIDARPSDCFVLALKNRSDLYVTDKVFDRVQDFSNLNDDESELASWMSGGFSAIVPKESTSSSDFDLGDQLPPGLLDPPDEDDNDNEDGSDDAEQEK